MLPTGFRLTFAQAQYIGNLQAQRQLVQGVLLDEVGAHARQVPLRQIAEPLVQQARDGEVEHGIAQKFQPFIVIGRKNCGA